MSFLGKPTVLVVEPASATGTLASLLDDAGYDVISCPGPHAPDFSCLGAEGRRCPLTDPADIVVLDLHLESDDVMVGPPGWEMMLYYVSLGKKVVAVVEPAQTVAPIADDQVAVVHRPADLRSLVAAIGALDAGKAYDSHNQTG